MADVERVTDAMERIALVVRTASHAIHGSSPLLARLSDAVLVCAHAHTHAHTRARARARARANTHTHTHTHTHTQTRARARARTQISGVPIRITSERAHIH
jgi:hypothetical protein